MSVINQGYANIEFIIIDGGSSDNTIDVIKKYSPHIAYWISEKDNGQADAINKGFRKATGDIITWINSDDLLTEGALNKVADFFSNCKESIGLIHGNTILFGNKNAIKISKGVPCPTIERYISGIAFAQPSSFIRKKYWDIIGELNENYHFGMDYDLFSKLALICEFKKVDETFSKYRLHATSKSMSQNKLFIGDWIDIYNNLLFNLNENKYISLQKQLSIKTSISDFKYFSFEFKLPKIDMELSFYYFLTYVVSSDYRNTNFKRAKEIIKFMNSNYKEFLSEDRETKKIANRLKILPERIINSYRSMKK